MLFLSIVSVFLCILTEIFVQCEVNISLPKNYNRYQIPPNEYGAAGVPFQVHCRFQVMRERDVSLGRQIGITDMNPEQQSIQVTIYFRLKYVDHRINIAVSDSNIQVNITYQLL